MTGAHVREAQRATVGALVRRAQAQGLTLVHFSGQLERFLWDRGCV